MERAAKVIATMAEVTAWGRLRSGGRQSSASADELRVFGQATDWRLELSYACQYAAPVMADFGEYAAACDPAGISPPDGQNRRRVRVQRGLRRAEHPQALRAVVFSPEGTFLD